MGHKVRLITMLTGCIAAGVLLVYVAFHQLYQNGLQAEAKLMISYVHTLERVYKLDKKNFVFWTEPYGAMLNGRDNCAQPEAAADIGFYISGCHREGAAIPRYAYRILKESASDRYRIEASSGSDKEGRSFVCFDSDKQNVWQSSQNLEFSQVESCW
jgi:hypothetical protein